MEKIRQEILDKAEDKWTARLRSFPDNIATKHFFKARFNLGFNEIKDWMTQGKVVAKNERLEVIQSLQSEMDELEIKLGLQQTGINYQGKYDTSQIVEALKHPNNKIEDFVISREGYFHLKDMFILIEDDDLFIACLQYLLEKGNEIEK